MKNYFIITIISFSFLGTAQAALSPAIVKESALKHHPTVLAAIAKMQAGEEAVKGAKGAFDTKIVSEYRRQTKHPYDSTVSRSQIEKPLRVANSKIYIGTEQVSNPLGIFSPIYNTSNPGYLSGNYTLLGMKFSFWKNLTLDPSRANLKNAQFDAQIAKSEKKLTEWDIGRLGQLTYWNWVTAIKVKNAYETLLKNGETRNEYLMARNKKGDIATILVTENEQYVARRKGAYQAAQERLLRAEYDLALFYRDDQGNPIIPNNVGEYEDYPANFAALLEKLNLNSDIEQLMSKRPDLKNLALNVAKTEVDLELARQDLRPQLDLTTEYFNRTIDHRPEIPKDYMMVMAQVSIPIERDLGNGNIGAARARQMMVQKQTTLAQQSFRFEIEALRKALNLQLEQVVQAEIEFEKTKELVVAENMKFKTGGGSLFLVNLREEAQASAERDFQESRLAFMDTLLTYQALSSTEE